MKKTYTKKGFKSTWQARAYLNKVVMNPFVKFGWSEYDFKEKTYTVNWIYK